MWVGRGLPMVSDDVEGEKNVNPFSQGAIKTARMNWPFEKGFHSSWRPILRYLKDIEHPRPIYHARYLTVSTRHLT